MIRYIPGTIPGLEGIQQIAIIDGDTHIGKWVEESGRLDHDQNALPRIGALIKPDMVVYDVGAFIGDHTAFYASKAARVFAFECNPEAFRCLKSNVTEKLHNATACLVAIGDDVSGGVLQSETNAGASFLWSEATNIHSVPGNVSTSLDFLRITWAMLYPHLIKLDIEGWEVRALRGARETITCCHPIIVCEVNAGALQRAGTSPGELYVLLSNYGYTMRDLFTDEPWNINDTRPQFDVVCEFKKMYTTGLDLVL